MSTDSSAAARPERLADITEAVLAEGTVRIEALAERFQVSLMTVHRDLDELQRRGLVRKERGVATALPTSLVEASEQYRVTRQSAEKAAIARAAIGHLSPGQSVFLDDSTTVAALVPLLHSVTPLTVITNSLSLLTDLRSVADVTLMALGGTYYSWCSAFMGGVTNAAIRHLRADVAVMSSAAVVDGVCFHQNAESVETKRAMFEQAATRIMLVDHTKFERRALHALLPLADFDAVVVDAGTPAAVVDDLRARGAVVHVASQ
ncbi:DeoR/GlpR family DNA-binding transcription regulator [Microcella sp.]|uniref:DeoR/GlpR family DNA-binding transcription regulator n=1 Tax=Microcella sp. TaxID=1913979 RepID=UPI002618108A|nr:DeoR/GlpR family DNA-binding transcription regulator [Microcella sp.]